MTWFSLSAWKWSFGREAALPIYPALPEGKDFLRQVSLRFLSAVRRNWVWVATSMMTKRPAKEPWQEKLQECHITQALHANLQGAMATCKVP